MHRVLAASKMEKAKEMKSVAEMDYCANKASVKGNLRVLSEQEYYSIGFSSPYIQCHGRKVDY